MNIMMSDLFSAARFQLNASPSQNSQTVNIQYSLFLNDSSHPFGESSRLTSNLKTIKRQKSTSPRLKKLPRYNKKCLSHLFSRWLCRCGTKVIIDFFLVSVGAYKQQRVKDHSSSETVLDYATFCQNQQNHKTFSLQKWTFVLIQENKKRIRFVHDQKGFLKSMSGISKKIDENQSVLYKFQSPSSASSFQSLALVLSRIVCRESLLLEQSERQDLLFSRLCLPLRSSTGTLLIEAQQFSLS